MLRILSYFCLKKKLVCILGITENLRWFYEDTRGEYPNLRESDDDVINMAARHQHSIRCFSENDQDGPLSKANRRDSEEFPESNDHELPQLIVHFYTSLPVMSVFVSGLIQEFSRLLFDIEVQMQPQSATASKILSIVKEQTDRKKALSKNNLLKISDPNNNNRISSTIQQTDVNKVSSSDWTETDDVKTAQEKKEAKNSPEDDFKFYASEEPANGSQVASFQRRRRIAESDANPTSDKENFYKYTIQLKGQVERSSCHLEIDNSTASAFGNRIALPVSANERFYSPKAGFSSSNQNSRKPSLLSLDKKSLGKRRKVGASPKTDFAFEAAKRVVSLTKSLGCVGSNQQQKLAFSTSDIGNRQTVLPKQKTINNLKPIENPTDICTATCCSTKPNNAAGKAFSSYSSSEIKSSGSLVTQSNSSNLCKRTGSLSSQEVISEKLILSGSETNSTSAKQSPRLPQLSKPIIHFCAI